MGIYNRLYYPIVAPFSDNSTIIVTPESHSERSQDNERAPTWHGPGGFCGMVPELLFIRSFTREGGMYMSKKCVFVGLSIAGLERIQNLLSDTIGRMFVDVLG